MMKQKKTIQTPVIGLTSYGKKQTGEYHLPGLYIDAVRRAGGLAVLIPPDAQGAEYICERIDGIIMAGGGDINPESYQGIHHETIYNIDEERDQGEFKIAELVMTHEIPTLAICRGFQILNISLGGDLHEHLPDVYGEEIQHRSAQQKACPHEVSIAPDSKLSGILGRENVKIASWHHQALKNVAKGAVVTAESSDGVVEAIEVENHPWLIGVQWHPELTAAEDPLQQRLFDVLIKQACRYRF